VPKQCYEKVQKIFKCRNNVTKKYRRFVSVFFIVSALTNLYFFIVSALTNLQYFFIILFRHWQILCTISLHYLGTDKSSVLLLVTLLRHWNIFCTCFVTLSRHWQETMKRKSTEDLSVSKQCYEKVQKICKCRNNIMKKYWRFVSAETIKKYRFVSAETIRKYRFVSAETMLRKSTEDLSVPRQCSEKVQNICQRRHKYRIKMYQCRDKVTK
jgi:hypothetical protein